MQTYVFPHIGGVRVDLVGQQHILQCLEPIWNIKQETARRVMQRMAKVLDVASAKQFRTGENPVEIVKRANVLYRVRESLGMLLSLGLKHQSSGKKYQLRMERLFSRSNSLS